MQRSQGCRSRRDGVGDDEHSWAFDGYRKLFWHGGKNISWGTRWNSGDILGCALDIDSGEMHFSLNGEWEMIP